MTELQEILKIIQFETGYGDGAIAEKLSVARETINRANSSGENDKILAALKEKFKKEISQFVTRYSNSSRELNKAFGNHNQVLSDLQAIKDAAARIEGALKLKAPVKSGIDKVGDAIGRAARKGK